MCVRCVRKSKHLGLPKSKTFGQIKALAQSFHKNHIVGLYDGKTNLAVEAHLHRIQRALTNKKIYSRKDKKHGKIG